MINIIDFSGSRIPFTLQDLFSTSSGLLTLVGAFIVAGLSFQFAPLLVGLMFKALGTKGGRRAYREGVVTYERRKRIFRRK